MYQVIQLHRTAPDKPQEGMPCNGCGVCCASAPCPAGVLFSRRRRGACDALVWNDAEGRYRCGLVELPADHLPAGLRWIAPPLAPLIAQLARHFISAGSGCDCSLVVETR